MCRLETKHGIDRWTAILIVERKTVNRVQPQRVTYYLCTASPRDFHYSTFALHCPSTSGKHEETKENYASRRPFPFISPSLPRHLAGNQRHSTFSERAWMCLDILEKSKLNDLRSIPRDTKETRREIERKRGEKRERERERVLETRILNFRNEHRWTTPGVKTRKNVKFIQSP